ncbi:MAG: hypothetical protein HRT77_09250 [Halioglobus sp.]|nr:hypothetical protein [Halioglobus sp.]
MSSKKAVFETKDPSHATDSVYGAVPTRKNDVDAPVSKDALKTRQLAEFDFETGNPVEDGAEVAETSSFYTRDPGLGSGAAFQPGREGTYTGLDRRKIKRRSGIDRRNNVRFDLNKSDRRSSNGRREDDSDLQYW